MTALIHPTAIIDDTAVVADGVTIGPYSVVGPQVVIGAGCQIGPHVTLEAYTTLGERCKISPGAVIGGLPQDLNFKGERSAVVLGNDVTVRECVTINRATGEGNATVVGDGTFIMAYCHLAHNCQVGNEVIMANAAQMGGYVSIGDYAFVSSMSIAHQFVRIGRLAILAGGSGTRQDIPPFSMCDGRPSTILGLNKVGLRRRGIGAEARSRLKKAYQLLWFSQLNLSQAMGRIRTEIGPDPLVDELLAFVESSKRGIRRPEESALENASESAESDVDRLMAGTV